MGRRKVYADDRARRADLIQQPVQSLTRPAPRIENPHPRAQAQAPDEPAKFGFGESVEKMQFVGVIPRRRVAEQTGASIRDRRCGGRHCALASAA
jgi:hypothetical protein